MADDSGDFLVSADPNSAPDAGLVPEDAPAPDDLASYGVTPELLDLLDRENGLDLVDRIKAQQGNPSAPPDWASGLAPNPASSFASADGNPFAAPAGPPFTAVPNTPAIGNADGSLSSARSSPKQVMDYSTGDVSGVASAPNDVPVPQEKPSPAQQLQDAAANEPKSLDVPPMSDAEIAKRNAVVGWNVKIAGQLALPPVKAPTPQNADSTKFSDQPPTGLENAARILDQKLQKKAAIVKELPNLQRDEGGVAGLIPDDGGEPIWVDLPSSIIEGIKAGTITPRDMSPPPGFTLAIGHLHLFDSEPSGPLRDHKDNPSLQDETIAAKNPGAIFEIQGTTRKYYYNPQQ